MEEDLRNINVFGINVKKLYDRLTLNVQQSFFQFLSKYERLQVIIYENREDGELMAKFGPDYHIFEAENTLSYTEQEIFHDIKMVQGHSQVSFSV